MNPTNEDVHKLIRVLKEAGWIERATSDNIVFTEKGLERMEVLAAALPAFLVIFKELQMPASFVPLLLSFVQNWKSDNSA